MRASSPLSRIFTEAFGLIPFCVVGAITLAAAGFSAEPRRVDLVAPMKRLFSHPAHREAFKNLGVSCTDCHDFGEKPRSPDPLEPGVPSGSIAPSAKTCHECHLGKISVARPDQCALCHANTRRLMPENHFQNWRLRHGSQSAGDPVSCASCHSQSTCTQCHQQQDAFKPAVHRPNFRVTHSIEARANPQSCATCHSSVSACVDCHSRGKR